MIGCEDRLRNDLYCVGWGVKLYSNQPAHIHPSRDGTDRRTPDSYIDPALQTMQAVALNIISVFAEILSS